MSILLRRRIYSNKKRELQLFVKEFYKGEHTWIVPAGATTIDAFVVGGGGYGGSIDMGAGGGGYTKLIYNVPVTQKEQLVISVGAGGTSSVNRGNTVLISALGGSAGTSSSYVNGRKGGNGGSGGGGGCHGSDGIGGAGGKNGSNGYASSKSSLGGDGQGTSTICPFNNKMYAGGGAGMRWNGSPVPTGGEGGGGDGGSTYPGVAAKPGTDNTGGGGGNPAGIGGSGIIILRYWAYK